MIHVNEYESFPAPRIADIILPMNRPQYVSVPEGFISALAWKLFEWDRTSVDGKLPLALMYKTVESTSSKYYELVETAPNEQYYSAFGDALKAQGLGPEKLSSAVLGEAIANSVAGIKPEGGKGQAASPISPGFALLQNMRGIQKAGNPPDLAEILETLYKLGLPSGAVVSDGVATRWKNASDRRLRSDHLLSAMDRAAKAELLGHGLRIKDQTVSEMHGRGWFQRTPYAWFVRSWDRLTDPVWVDALPARVWVDWATTVLRLGVGLGFLWESAWYEYVGRTIVGAKDATWQDLHNGMPDCLPWKSSKGTQSVRDVASVLKWRVNKGTGVRRVLDAWLKSSENAELSFAAGWQKMIGDSSLRLELTDALASREQPGTNSWEAIKYALQTRDSSGPFADYYGMLRQNGRFLTVEPGTEWIAVVASLACGKPEDETNVGELMTDLREMGLNPELSDIVALLERAGLARGSADADQGVIIRSAFETRN